MASSASGAHTASSGENATTAGNFVPNDGDVDETAVPALTDASASFDPARLKRLALWHINFLAAALVVSFFAGAALLINPAGALLGNAAIDQFLAVVFLGIAGSATAALTSGLDRYANGFEDEDGNKQPREVTEANRERFNERFAAWLRIRPLLGGVVAPVFIWGLAQFTDSPGDFLAASPDQATTLGFTAFMAGLLAKSVLELIKNLFKNVFRT